MSDVPSNLIPTRITGLPEYLGTSTLGYLPYVIDGNTYKVQFTNIAAVGAVPSTREINTGSGLGGGGDLSANRTLYILPEGVDDSRLTATGVTAATYGSADNIPVLTVNAQGRVTGVTDTPIVLSNYVPTSRTITAGAGLTGGGDLSTNRSFAVNFSSTTPEPLGPGSPGVSTVAAREDHVHPAVDLSDTTETQGVLPLSRGGTGNSLSPVVGAIAYSSNDALYLTPTSGNAGDVLVSGGGVSPPFWQAPIGGGTVTSINLTAGTGISVSGGPITTSGSISVVNTAPDQIVSLTGAGTTVVTGTYPSFTITSNDSTVGTVTSVAASGGTTGLTFSGSPITTSGTLTLGGTLAVANGGTGATVAGTARTNLGAAASGANTDITSIAITTGTISATPTSGTDIVNKLYADSIASGINFHQSVRLATAATLPANTYNNGASGVGATLTGNANGTLSVDGVAAVVGNRILVKNEVTQANNGVYTVTQVGSGSVPYILTRATDFDSAGSGVDEIDAGDFFLVTAGSTQSNTSWVQQTPLPITVGTTALVFTQFAAPVLYSAGTGLTLAGTVFSITNTGVSASTYGSASSVPVLAINSQGQVTSASSSSIAIAASQITSGTLPVANGGTGATSLTSGYLVKGNGTSAVSSSVIYDDGTNAAIGSGTAFGNKLYVAGNINASSQIRADLGTTGASFISTGTGSNFQVNHNGTSTVSILNTGGGIAFSPSGTERMRIDSSGNVGIGTTTPSSALDVNGGISVGRSASGQSIVAFNGDAVNAQQLQVRMAGTDGVIDATRNSGTTPNLRFLIDSSERMRLDGNGNFGIGTSSPRAMLDVGTNAPGTTTSTFHLGYSGLNFYGYRFANTITPSLEGGGTLSIQYGTSAAWVDAVTVKDNGSVGIGTSSPATKLDVNGAATVSGAVYSTAFINTSNGTSYFTDASTGNGLYVGGSTASPANTVRFSTSATERMRIDASGNVGIGTSSPSSKLTVASSNVTVNAGYGIAFTGDQARIMTPEDNVYGALINWGAAGGCRFIAGTSERMRIDGVGNLLVGTTTAVEKLTIGSGSATAAGVNLRTTTTDFTISPSNSAAGGVTISTSWVSGGQGPLVLANAGGEIIRFDASRNVTLTNKIVPNVQSIASASTITPNANTDTQVSVTALAVPATIAAPSGTPSDGQSLVIRIEDNGTARALTWTTGSSGAYRAVGITLPTTTVATKVMYIGFKYNSTDLRWDAIALSQEA